MSGEKGRKVLWVLWGLTTAVATATVILLLVTFSNFLSAQSHSQVTGVHKSQLSAALAGCVLSASLIILLQLISFFVLLRATTWAFRTHGGTSVPFISSSFLHVSLFLLLTGLILISNEHWHTELAVGGWTNGDTDALIATYYLCFFSTGFYIIMCVALLFLMRQQRDEIMFPDLETSLATQNLRPAAAPMSHEDGGIGYRRGVGAGSAKTRAESSATPSDYAESVTAARKAYGGAWGR